MFVLARYDQGAYYLTQYAFRALEEAQNFMSVSKFPSYSFIVIDCTMQRKVAA